MPDPDSLDGPDMTDPLWPMLPLLAAWPPAARGDLTAARAAARRLQRARCRGVDRPRGPGRGRLVFAAVGSPAQRRWTYERLLPHAGTRVIVDS